MLRPHSQLAIEQLNLLRTVDGTSVALSFTEKQNLATSRWAVSRFGGQVLIDRVVDEYKQNPDHDRAGHKIDLQELGGRRGVKLRDSQEAAGQVARQVAADLDGSWRKVQRGYDLADTTVRGTEDAFVIIGSLEKAIEVNSENLADNELYWQKASQYILEHMSVYDEPGSVSYLL